MAEFKTQMRSVAKIVGSIMKTGKVREKIMDRCKKKVE